MKDGVLAALAQAQWEITKGHMRASVALLSAQRVLSPVVNSAEDERRIDEWREFYALTEEFIDRVELTNWVE